MTDESGMEQGCCILQVVYGDAGTAVDRDAEANQAFESQIGMENAVGRTVRELVPDVDAFWIETLGGVALTGRPMRFTTQAKSTGRW